MGVVDRTDLDVDAAGVHALGEQDLLPVEAGRAHVDGDEAAARIGGDQPPAQGLDHGAGAPHFVHQQPGDAARAVAASPRPRSRRVECAEDVAACPQPLQDQSWSKPIPGGGRRGARRRDAHGKQPRKSGVSSTTKIVAEPCILRNGVAMGGLYRPRVPAAKAASPPVRPGLSAGQLAWSRREGLDGEAGPQHLLLAVGATAAAWPTRRRWVSSGKLDRGPRRRSRGGAGTGPPLVVGGDTGLNSDMGGLPSRSSAIHQ